MRKFFTCLLLSVISMGSSPVAAADFQQLASKDLPVQLEADELSYDRDRDLYRAVGDVTLTRGDFTVSGQSLLWNQQTGEIEAEGDVSLTSPDERLAGRRVYYNLQQGTGVIEDGHFFLRDQNLHIYGRRIERRGEVDYRIYDGTFTTCDGDVPSWKFGASQLDVTLGGYARARNALFYLKNIPSIYFPYMIYPAKTERESGLLIPSVGYSDKRGFQYSGAYYQVLGINQDATLYLDYLSEMGIGKGLEYRYIFGADNAGEARVYHIDVDQVDGRAVDEERYAVEWRHDGTLPGRVRLMADAEYVNDNDFFSDFGGIAGEYNKDQVQSNLFLNRHWGRYNLTGQLKYTQDLETEEDTTLQLLPRIVFDTARQKIGESVFYYRFASEYSHFWREEGLRGERLMVRPGLGMTVPLGAYFDLDPELAWRHRYYWGLSDDSAADDTGALEASARLSMAALAKDFSGSRGSWRHSVRPELVYRYVSEDDQEALPVFDAYDRISEANHLEYALVQRLVNRSADSEGGVRVRDVAYLRVGLLHDLRSEASGRRFTDLRTELTLTPADWLTLTSDSTFDSDRGRWHKFAVAATLEDTGENSLTARYRYNRSEDIEYAAAILSVAYLKPVYLNYEQRYDVTTDYRLEQRVGVEYRHQCWRVQLALRDREDDRSVMLSFNLSGLGSAGRRAGALEGTANGTP